jgi:KDO2-lipid IV(A) lauroyltransferase
MTSRDARDLREGGRWSRGQRLKNAFLYHLIRASLAAANRFSPAATRRLGRVVAAAAHLLLGRERRLANENVRQAFPALAVAERRALVRRVYRGLGEHLGDAVVSLRPDARVAPLRFPEVDRETLAQAQAEGRGVVFISAHLGPWERVAVTLVEAGFALTTIARESYDPRLTPLYDRLRGTHGVGSIYRGDSGAAFRMVRTLRHGNILGIPMDLRSRVPSIDVPFLGRSAPTAVGPARIALRTKAAVVVGTAARDKAGAWVLTMTRIATGDLAPLAARGLTERINVELSARIRALPDAWLWMHPRWT